MPTLTIDLRGSSSPSDDLRAINNCYSAITDLMIEGDSVETGSMSELMNLLESLMKQSIDNLDYEADATPEKTEQELTDVSKKIADFVQDKKYFKYLAAMLSGDGQSINTLPVGELLDAIDTWRAPYEQGVKL